jgi:putative flippase GtrA
MPQPATPCDSAAPAGSSVWLTLLRHQLGAVAATAVDFSSMIFLVERFGLTPVAGTAIGASLGAITNFVLGRIWVFRRHTGHWAVQALRYAFVSATSAGLNTAGEYLVHDAARVQYVLARVFVSIGVSLLWNFPMQRRFVFREGRG